MSVFQTALDAIFYDSNMAKDGVYTPPLGSPVAVRTILKRLDKDSAVFSAEAQLSELLADIRQSELAQPVEGATLEIESVTYIVRTFKLDREQLVWRLGLNQA